METPGNGKARHKPRPCANSAPQGSRRAGPPGAVLRSRAGRSGLRASGPVPAPCSGLHAGPAVGTLLLPALRRGSDPLLVSQSRARTSTQGAPRGPALTRRSPAEGRPLWAPASLTVFTKDRRDAAATRGSTSRAVPADHNGSFAGEQAWESSHRLTKLPRGRAVPSSLMGLLPSAAHRLPRREPPGGVPYSPYVCPCGMGKANTISKPDSSLCSRHQKGSEGRTV